MFVFIFELNSRLFEYQWTHLCVREHLAINGIESTKPIQRIQFIVCINIMHSTTNGRWQQINSMKKIVSCDGQTLLLLLLLSSLTMVVDESNGVETSRMDGYIKICYRCNPISNRYIGFVHILFYTGNGCNMLCTALI